MPRALRTGEVLLVVVGGSFAVISLGLAGVSLPWPRGAEWALRGVLLGFAGTCLYYAGVRRGMYERRPVVSSAGQEVGENRAAEDAKVLLQKFLDEHQREQKNS